MCCSTLSISFVCCLRAHISHHSNEKYGLGQTSLPPQTPPAGLDLPTQTTTLNAPNTEYPIALAAQTLSLEEIKLGATRVQLDAAAVARYRQTPDLLLRQIFISEDEPAFRVSYILITETGEKLFYLVFAGEGPKAVSYSSEDPFAMRLNK